MNDLPDAPWIRDAETNGVGYDDDKEFTCPVCGAAAPDYVYSTGRHASRCDIIGCSECVKEWPGWQIPLTFMEGMI